MSDTLAAYAKKHDCLICVDSDGCAMDTMDVKHFRCFGPCMVREWKLEQWSDSVLSRWNDINLYTMTRGINRFKGLAMALREINAQYMKIEGIDELERWVESAPALSNDGLQTAIDHGGGPILQKAMRWSKAVNEQINALPFERKKPFSGVLEGLKYAHSVADIAIVSSANLQAVEEEWALYGLLEHVDILLAQDVGSKAFCIAELLKKGYDKEKVLMTGDAPGDLDAVKSNGVFYYPILVRHEAESWTEFRETAVNRLISRNYSGTYQNAKIEAFLNNLK